MEWLKTLINYWLSEIIDDIGDVMEQTNDRLIRNTRNIKKVSLKSSTCGKSWEDEWNPNDFKTFCPFSVK